MLKIGVFSLTMVGMLLNLSNCQFTDAMCGDAIIKANGLTGRVQCNYKLKASKRFSFDGTVQKLTAFTDDLAHSKNAGGKDPRTEVTFRDSYGYTKADTASFECKFMVSEGVTQPFSFFQVKKDSKTKPTTGIMLNFRNGNF